MKVPEANDAQFVSYIKRNYFMQSELGNLNGTKMDIESIS